MTLILDGKKASVKIAGKLAGRIAKKGLKPKLAIIQVGNLYESNAYIGQKKKLGEKIGCEVEHVRFPVEVPEEKIISEIKKLNGGSGVNGIIVQLPVPGIWTKRK